MSDDLTRAPTRNKWADIANQSADRIRDLEAQLKQANDAAFNEGIEAAMAICLRLAIEHNNEGKILPEIGCRRCVRAIYQLKRT
jgi:hypothetical protein